MTLDRATSRTLLLICWCAFMTWLWASGETLRYLGPRTQWLVPFGACALALTAVAGVLAARRADEERERLTVRDALGLSAFALPIVTGLLLAHSSLGAQAASQKLTSRGIDPAALADLASGDARELSFLQLSVAQKDAGFARDHDIRPGREVRLLGFVSRAPSSARGPFQVSRFYITCCVADSLPIGVTIDGPDGRRSRPRRDQWLDVTGQLVRARGGRLAVQAARIREVAQPRHPYLSFTQ